ncbi:S41 family peptidase [Mucilaginibacter sp. UR6-11]|uniref:S41 family peptidase n=1 Tax=Mucilaginibacter sp. UR6-11 TaxID=1435644 RepID=UPI001E5B4157|nr:S41 family peptidase [Mucilaginibacter sp. UR6-11]MCC8423807.1 hypothetical protein [Mucilaginibacter sp. UR6-11]
MLKKFGALAICILLYSSVSGQKFQRKFSPSEMRQDLDTLVKYLEETHPKIYYRYPKEKFYKDVQIAKNGFSRDFGDTEFYLIAESLLAKLDDGHTDFDFMWQYNSQNPFVFPYNVKLSAAKPFIICNGPYQTITAQLPANAEIISVNDIPSSKIVDDVINLNTGENRSFRADFGSGRFYFYLEALYKANGNYKVKYKSNGKEKTVLIKGIRKEELDKRTKEVQAKIIKTNSAPTTNYSLKIVDENKTAIIDFKSFDWNGYKAFADSAFTVIKNKGVKNLVINLMDDGGGDSDVGDDFFQYILDKPFHQYDKVVIKNSRFLKERLKAHRKDKTLSSADKALLAKPNGLIDTVTYGEIPIKTNPLRFNGKIYLLVNLQTYSSAADFAQCFKYYKRGTVIGEETGGLVKSYGDIVSVSLPHTQLDLTISSSLYYDVGAKENDWKGVIPDVVAPSSKALNKALDLIKNQKK